MRGLLFAALLGSLSLTALTAHAQPLPQLVQGVMQNHPRLSQLREEVAAQTATVKEAQSGYYPVVNGSVGTGYETVDRTDVPFGIKTDESVQSHNASVTQNLFNGFATTSQKKVAESAVKASQENLRQTEQQVLFEAATAYLEVLRNQELIQLSGENIENLRSQLNLEDERVKRGSGIAVDVLQAKSRLQIARERQVAFQGRMQQAISSFQEVFGEMPHTESMTMPVLPEQMLPNSIESAQASAGNQHPVLALNEMNLTGAKAARSGAKAGYYPSVDVVGRYNYDDNLSGIIGTEERYTVLTSLNWNLFTGFADQARAERAAHGYYAAQAAYRTAERQVEEAISLAWSNLETNRERTEVLKNAVTIANEVYDARLRLRDAGKETALNVLDAENELYRARIAATSAEYDYYIATYQMLQAMGLLSADVLLLGAPVTAI